MTDNPIASQYAPPLTQKYAVQSIFDEIDGLVQEVENREALCDGKLSRKASIVSKTRSRGGSSKAGSRAPSFVDDALTQNNNSKRRNRLTSRPDIDKRHRLSLSDRRVLSKVEGMTEEDKDELEQRYQEYKRQDREKQQALKVLNDEDIKKPEKRISDLKRRFEDEASHGDNVQQQRRERQEASEKTMQLEIALRQEDRDLTTRRNKRLLVIITQTIFAKKLLTALSDRDERQRKIHYFRTVWQPRVWAALAMIKLRAALRRNMFMRYFVKKMRYRRKTTSVKLIVLALRDRKKRLSVRVLYRAAIKVQRWWRWANSERKSRALLLSLQWDLMWDSFYEKKLAEGNDVISIPGEIKYRVLRNVIRRKAINHADTLVELEVLRTETKKAVESGKTRIEDLDPTTRMLLHSDHVPRLKYLMRADEVQMAIEAAYAHTKKAMKENKWHSKREDGSRSEIEQQEESAWEWIIGYYDKTRKSIVQVAEDRKVAEEEEQMKVEKTVGYDVKTGRKIIKLSRKSDASSTS